MGLHTIQFTWNITLREPHEVTVTRIGYIWTDTLEIALDDKRVASRKVGSLMSMGFSIDRQEIRVEDRLMEIRWKYQASGDPRSIVLIDNNKILAQYGDRSAAKSVPTFDEIDPGNLIPLIKGAQNVTWNPFKSPTEYQTNYLDLSPLRKWFYRITNQFGSPALPPISIKTGGELALDSLGQEIGFGDEALMNRLVTHSQRLQKWRQRVPFIYGPIFLVFLVFIMLLSFGLAIYLNSTNFFYIFLPCYFLAFTAGSISTKLAYWLASAGEAEMLCVTTILYTLAELKEEDALIHPDKKQVLLARMSYLARQTHHLARRDLSKRTNVSNQIWVKEHFNEIEARIRKLERWVYAPMASTLPDLRSELHQLAQIYITGLYGEFTYQPRPQGPVPEEQPKRFGFLKGVVTLLPKLLLFLLLIVLPIILMTRLPPQLNEGEKLFAGLDLVQARSLLVSLLGLGLTGLFNLNASELVNKIGESAQAS